MDLTTANNVSRQQQRKTNQNIQVYVRVRPLNSRERCIRSAEVIDVVPPREIITRHTLESKLTKKFTFDRAFGPESKQVDVYSTVVAPLIEEVLSGYNCTVFAYGQTGTGKTHTMVGNECAELKSSWEDDSDIGIIPRALSHLFDELRLMEVEYTMRISYLELYNEELCDLLSTDDTTKIRIFDDSTKKGSVIIQGLEEIPVHSKDDVYKLLEKGKERRKTATTLMNAQSSRSHTVFSILVHIRENGLDGEDMLKIGKLNLVDLAGSENVSKAGNEKGIRVRETVNINQSLLTLGRVITALVERTPHIPYRESKLTRLLQESLGGRTKTSIIATISPGHKDIEETLSTLEYAHRAKNIQNKPEVNQKLAKKTVLKEYTEEIDKLKRDLMAARDKNGIYLAEETYSELTLKMDSQNRELNEKMLLLKALKDELANKEKIFNEVSLSLVEKTEELKRTEKNLTNTKGTLLMTKKVLNKTKRRYKEKKVLIDSHVKTEQELITKASQILEVADIATSDTHKLHNTIERRQDVDQKIRTACECFTERMEDNFEMFEDNLIQFQKKHNSATSMFDEELSKSTEVNNRLFSNSEKGIENIKMICLQSLALNNEFNIEFAEAMTGLSEEHRAKLTRLLENLKSRESNMKSDILATIHELESNYDLQKTTIDTLHNTCSQAFKRNTEAISAHVREVRDQFGNITSLAKSNLENVAKLQTELNNENALVNQEQLIIEDFCRQMQQIKELRLNNTQNMSKFLAQIEANNKSTETQAQQNNEVGVLFDKQQQAEHTASMANMDQHVETALLSIDRSVAKCSKLQMQVDNLSEAISTELSNLSETDNTYCGSVQKLSVDNTEKAKRMRLEGEEQLCTASANLHDVIKEETQRLRGHVAVAALHVGEMKTHLTEYTNLHKKNLADATDNVSKFYKSELKTYSSTGTTPSKRDFIYPRVLSATSPHQDIVKRYRQEQDWSDLDTTVTIDECSENENEIEPHSVREFSQTEAMLNSTPVLLDTQQTPTMPNNSRSANSLKPTSNQRNNNSRTRTITPRKSSPRCSPAVNRSNKENVA